MANISGMRDYTSDSALIVRDVSDTLSKIHPQENAFITLLLKASSESGDRRKFEHLEDDWVGNTVNTTAAYTNETTIAVSAADGLKIANRDILMNPTTGENILVTAGEGTTSLTVVRAYGSVAASAIATTDTLSIIGSAAYEGGSSLTSVTSVPDSAYNYTQDFQHIIKLSDIDAAEKKYGPNTRAYLQAKRMVEHKNMLNAAFWFGQKKLDTTAGKVTHACGGLYGGKGSEGITTNIKDLGGQPITDKALFDFIAMVRDYSDGTNLYLFASSTLLTEISLLQMRLVRLQQASTKYGINITQLTALGTTVNVVEEKAFNRNGFPNLGVLVDMNNVKIHYFSGEGLSGKTKLSMNKQNPGDHFYVDEVRTIAGPRLRNEKSHAVITGWA